MSKDLNTNDLSKEEILKLLGEKGIDIRALAAEAKNIKKNGATLQKKEKTQKHETTWSLVMNDHNDFAIKRETGSNWKMLVVMTSQGIGYFKTKDGTAELERNQLVGFLRGMPTIEIPNSWIKKLGTGAEEADALLAALENPDVMEGFKFNCGPEYDRYMKPGWSKNNQSKYSWYSPNRYQEWVNVWRLHSQLLKDYRDNKKATNLILKSPAFIKNIEERWDKRNVRDFLDAYTLALVDVKNDSLDIDSYGYRSRYADADKNVSGIPTFNMEYNAFKDYVLYDSYRMGYAENMDSFFTCWRDTIKMEEKIYGKIKEKYPKNLQTYHDCLSYKTRKLEEKINNEMLTERVEGSKFLETTVNNYIFTTPNNREDFLDEAEQQCNCLASYVSKVIDGDCYIVFCREKTTPENSFITIEVRENPEGTYRIVQQYLAHNKKLSDSQQELTKSWIAKINQKIIKEATV